MEVELQSVQKIEALSLSNRDVAMLPNPVNISSHNCRTSVDYSDAI